VLWIAAAVAVVLVGGRYLLRPSAAPAPSPAAPVRVQSSSASSVVLVHVAGAVRRPGVYRLRSGSRIDDAVTRAGGATSSADLSAVNLAAKAEDGRQVLVPERAPKAAAAPSGPASSAAPGAPISLTSATAEQLDTLPGVGPATAEKILAYRDEHGGFGSIDDLANVPGIGDKRLATLKDLVRP
jgi:competence protein ComEA